MFANTQKGNPECYSYFIPCLNITFPSGYDLLCVMFVISLSIPLCNETESLGLSVGKTAFKLGLLLMLGGAVTGASKVLTGPVSGSATLLFELFVL